MADFPAEPVKVEDSSFDEFVQKYSLTVIDCWAPWCGPCRVVGPVLEEIASELGDQVTIGKVNVDEHPALASRFGIQAIPQLLFFKDGAEKDRLVGAVPKREILKRLENLAG